MKNELETDEVRAEYSNEIVEMMCYSVGETALKSKKMVKFLLDDPYTVEALSELIFYDDYLYDTFKTLADSDGEDKDGKEKKRGGGIEMPGSKYERELRFIDTETRRLGKCLQELCEMMPADPVEAARKADEVFGIEAKIGELLRRRREIEDSFIAAGMDVPDTDRKLNANVYMEGPAFEAPPRQAPAAKIHLEESVEDLTAEIESVTDDLMGIGIKMLRAEMNGDEDEKQKLSMMASSLKSRRDILVESVKRMRAKTERAPEPEIAPADCSELQGRIKTLETDARALRSQISSVRTDVAEIKETLRQIKKALSIDD